MKDHIPPMSNKKKIIVISLICLIVIVMVFFTGLIIRDHNIDKKTRSQNKKNEQNKIEEAKILNEQRRIDELKKIDELNKKRNESLNPTQEILDTFTDTLKQTDAHLFNQQNPNQQNPNQQNPNQQIEESHIDPNATNVNLNALEQPAQQTNSSSDNSYLGWAWEKAGNFIGGCTTIISEGWKTITGQEDNVPNIPGNINIGISDNQNTNTPMIQEATTQNINPFMTQYANNQYITPQVNQSANNEPSLVSRAYRYFVDYFDG